MLTSPVSSQQISQSQLDSGWVSLFDGKSLAGFYSANRGDAPNYDLTNHPDGIFSVRASDSSIRSEGFTTAHLLTKKSFSHYRVRVKVKYDNTGSLWLNSGLIYHTRIEAPRLYGTYPRSIEFQGQKRGMGEAWTISKIFVNTTIDPTSDMHKYKNNGFPVAHGGDDPNRQCLGSSNPFIDGAWNEMEAVVRGSDSSVHIVNGITVFRCTKLRWSDTNDPNDMRQMLGSGALGLQVEGDAPNYVAPISYKGYMIMELDSVSGKPVNAKPTTSLLKFDSKSAMKQNSNSITEARRTEYGQNLSHAVNGRRNNSPSPFPFLWLQ